jgi:protein TonB
MVERVETRVMRKLPSLIWELRREFRERSAPAINRLHAMLGRLQSPDRWPAWNWGPLATLEPSSRVLAIAIAVSIVLHAMVLAIQFRLPDTLRKWAEQPLEVVLVNSKTRSRPTKADVHAQANLDGGGNTDENRRAKTPLPVLPSAKPGNDLVQAAQRVKQLEAEQRQVLTQQQPTAPQAPQTAPVQPEPQQPLSGVDLAARSLAIARLEAQISRSIDEYNSQ